ncbi:RepB family plasmid replication initiator protein [Falsigemmobacter faecalis]|uniref:RepB family plasmid replication initiator protein n=2 Tax=Falsigemmobacter faecalis TaxID=2488730 RepID=A0A3P3DAA1_9RHOB|nr:RepB family plasmid replication initiator protein [Falsigemmobacter faecalis]
MMDEATLPKGYDGTTLSAFQRRGEVIKPVELIEVRGGERMTLLARRIYNQLLANAFGPNMADEGRMFKITMAELRGNNPSSQRVIEALGVLRRTDVTVILTNGDVLSVQLLGPTIRSRCGRYVSYEFHSSLIPILRDSQIFARLEMEILHGFTTKYGMALYEIISKRVRLKHVLFNDFDIDEFRDYLGVPKGALASFGALRVKALEPAVEEVNLLAPFSCRIDVAERLGRKVTRLRVTWWDKTKDELKAQWQAQRERQFDLFEDEKEALTGLDGLSD